MPETPGASWAARWVRWKEFASWTPWQPCEGVELHGPWLVVHLLGRTVAVPDHIVRQQVEWTLGEDQPEAGQRS